MVCVVSVCTGLVAGTDYGSAVYRLRLVVRVEPGVSRMAIDCGCIAVCGRVGVSEGAAAVSVLSSTRHGPLSVSLSVCSACIDPAQASHTAPAVMAGSLYLCLCATCQR